MWEVREMKKIAEVITYIPFILLISSPAILDLNVFTSEEYLLYIYLASLLVSVIIYKDYNGSGFTDRSAILGLFCLIGSAHILYIDTKRGNFNTEAAFIFGSMIFVIMDFIKKICPKENETIDEKKNAEKTPPISNQKLKQQIIELREDPFQSMYDE